MISEQDTFLKKIRNDRIESKRRVVDLELEELARKCIIYPIVLIVVGALVRLFSWILCEIPILSIIVCGFKIHILLNGIATFCWIVGISWILIGIIVYRYKERKIELEFEKEKRELMNYVPDDTTYAMLAVIDKNPERFVNSNQSDKNQESINYSGTSNVEKQNISITYENDREDYERRTFSYVDASGAYRRWGDDFIDCKGNWCKWGEGFYDMDGNYVKWGEMYKDKSGAYRRWGEDFVDGAGNYVKCPRG